MENQQHDARGTPWGDTKGGYQGEHHQDKRGDTKGGCPRRRPAYTDGGGIVGPVLSITSSSPLCSLEYVNAFQNRAESSENYVLTMRTIFLPARTRELTKSNEVKRTMF